LAGTPTGIHNANPGNELQERATDRKPSIDPPVLHDTCLIDPDLAQINAACPTLPEDLKAGIVAMVKAASRR
jgi:hypothetical protein